MEHVSENKWKTSRKISTLAQNIAASSRQHAFFEFQSQDKNLEFWEFFRFLPRNFIRKNCQKLWQSKHPPRPVNPLRSIQELLQYFQTSLESVEETIGVVERIGETKSFSSESVSAFDGIKSGGIEIPPPEVFDGDESHFIDVVDGESDINQTPNSQRFEGLMADFLIFEVRYSGKRKRVLVSSRARTRPAFLFTQGHYCHHSLTSVIAATTVPTHSHQFCHHNYQTHSQLPPRPWCRHHHTHSHQFCHHCYHLLTTVTSDNTVTTVITDTTISTLTTKYCHHWALAVVTVMTCHHCTVTV